MIRTPPLPCKGLHSGAGESWSLFHAITRAFLHAPEEWMLFCGMVIGQEDPAQPINRMHADRARLSAFCRSVEWKRWRLRSLRSPLAIANLFGNS